MPLHKKGDRNERGNYRGVCLLSMCSRVLAKQLAWWAEHLELLYENQAGFRKGRSTTDVVKMMIQIQEDVDDCKRRVRQFENEREINEGDDVRSSRKHCLRWN